MGKKHSGPPQRQQVMSVSKNWSGPLPSPQDLDQYNKWIPGLGEKIVENYLTESNHRRSCETEQLSQNRQVIEANAKAIVAQNRVTEITAYTVMAFVFVALFFGMYLIYMNRQTEGWISVIGILVSVFFGRKKLDRNNQA